VITLALAHHHHPVERRHRPRERGHLRATERAACSIALAEVDRALVLHRLQADVARQRREPQHRRHARAAPSPSGGEARDDDAAEPEIDDEGRAPRDACIGKRRVDHGAEGGDQVARDVKPKRDQTHAEVVAPGDLLAAVDFGKQPSENKRPHR
jgi:hypothetical protein